MDLLLWAALLVGLVALLIFAWRSASRRRGFRLVGVLERQEDVLRYVVDVAVSRSGDPPESRTPWQRRGTLVLTDRRLAGFAGRTRFVVVRTAADRLTVSARGEWLIVHPLPGDRAVLGRPIGYRVGSEAEEWAREVRKRILRGARRE